MSTSLKVLTYNIHKGFNVGNRSLILHGIKQAFQLLEPDILVLQEVIGEHEHHQKNYQGWPTSSQIEFLADQLWPHHAYGKNAIYKAGHHGNAILSKYAIIQWDNINVSFMKSASRSLLHGVISIPGVNLPLHIICVHFGLFSYERKRQAIRLMARIRQHIPEDQPLIIAGDFNDWHAKVDGYFKEKLHVTEVFKQYHGHHAKTFPAWLPLLPMDRIYVRGLELQTCEALSGSPWTALSDHLPLMAQFNY
jgi:endonuclease/exonuclease/phosphatase family metal-dependent hydrolase